MFGGSKSSAPAAPARAAPARAAPAPSHVPAPAAAPPSALARPSAPTGGGFMSTVMDGLAFGTGSAIAHRAVGAIASSFTGGSGSAPAEQQQAAAAPAAAPESGVSYAATRGQDCSPFQQEFVKCLADNKNDIASCQMQFETFTQCQTDNRLQ